MKSEDFLGYFNKKMPVVESIPRLQRVGMLTLQGLKTNKNIPDGSKLYNESGTVIGTYNALSGFNIDWINKNAIHNGESIFIEKSVQLLSLQFQFESQFAALLNEEKLKEAFDLGYDAAYYGDSRRDCPYKKGTVKYNEWNRGFTECNTPGAGLKEDATAGAVSAGAVAASPNTLFKKKKMIKRK